MGLDLKAGCIRCEEIFPIDQRSAWAMGKCRTIGYASKELQQQIKYELDRAYSEGAAETVFLCGNCFFDLMARWCKNRANRHKQATADD